MSSPVLIGVDVGTQSVKAGAFDLDGTCRAEAAVPLALHRSSADQVEQVPEDFYRAATSAIASCAGRLARPGDVAGLAVAGQMAGILGIGGDGQAVTPYDSWLDSRCRPEVQQVAARLGDRLIELSGCPPMVAHAPKLAWWRHHRPEVYRSVAKFVVPSAFVAGRLCGLRAEGAYIDHTHLHFSGLADTAAARWSAELAAGSGVELGKLPRVVAPTEVVGHLSAGAARDCGLLAGTPVAAGLGDTAAGVLGAGVVEPGQLLDTAGTASVLGLSTPELRPDFSRTLVQMRGAVPGQWFALAYLAGGDLLEWLSRVLGGADLSSLVEEAAACPPARLVFVPHLAGRILPSAPTARGAWVGLDLSQTRGDLVRSALESVAFEYAGFLERAAALFPDVALGDVRVIGGGAGNDLWNRVKASVLGLSYVRLERDNFSCWGAALVAGAAVGALSDLAGAARASAVEASRSSPDPSLQQAYRERLQEYRSVAELLVARSEEVLV